MYSLADAFYWCPAFADEGRDGIVEEATVAVSLHNTLPHRYNGCHFSFHISQRVSKYLRNSFKEKPI